MSKVVRVFVSYSRHDAEVDRIAALTTWLGEQSRGKLEFILDSRLQPGQSIYDFERVIRLYDCVLVIATREYKRKSQSLDFGVSREYRFILEGARNKECTIFVAVMEDGFVHVVPEELKEYLTVDFVGLDYDRSSKTISSSVKTIFHGSAIELIKAMEALSKPRRNHDATLADIRKKLFFEPKQEIMSAGMPDNVFNKIFVKTSCYYAVEKRAAYLFIGRKGSGKSFLTEYFTRNPRVANEIAVTIHLRNYNLSNIYNMKTSLRIGGEIGTNLTQIDVLEAAWTLFFSVAVMAQLFVKVLANTYPYELFRLVETQKFIFSIDCISPKDENGDYDIDYGKLIDWSIEKVFHFVDVGINKLAGEYAKAISVVPTLVHPDKIVPSVVGIPVLKEFQRSISDIRPSFLVTVDGFDTNFDRFRKDTNTLVFDEADRNNRIKFETDWLCGLIEATGLLVDRVSHLNISAFSNTKFNFLVTLPRDRFSEVLREDRDAYRLRFRFVEIRWTGIELMNVIRKRLEVYYGSEAIKSNIADRLNESLKWIGDIPQVMKFKINDKIVEIPLFCFFLRHTFWRPRDILFHVAELIYKSELYRPRSRELSVEVIRQIALEASKAIIRDEFLREFSSIFPKVEHFLKLFRRSKIELTFAEFYSLVMKEEVRLSSGEKLTKIEEKASFLYEIGFIGIVLGDEIRNRLGLKRREAFSFSCKLEFGDLDMDNLQEAHWVIHPIFSEYLQLNSSSAPFLLNYTIEELLSDE